MGIPTTFNGPVKPGDEVVIDNGRGRWIARVTRITFLADIEIPGSGFSQSRAPRIEIELLRQEGQ
jgi:hypothetical protein